MPKSHLAIHPRRRAAVLVREASPRKQLVRRFVEEVMNGGRLDVLDETHTPAFAIRARRWIEPFLSAFPDMRMEVVQLVEEESTVVGRFRCSATHLGTWRGHAPSGRRFSDVDEVYFFEFEGGRIAGAWGIEDTESRKRQLGLLAP